MNPSRLPLRFTARVISGSGRGRTLRVPTLNLDLREVPRELNDGVYACRATFGGKTFPASMHRGSRPTFHDTPSCEVHILDERIADPPRELTVEVVQCIREIAKFPSTEALSRQMLEDNAKARDILGP